MPHTPQKYFKGLLAAILSLSMLFCALPAAALQPNTTSGEETSLSGQPPAGDESVVPDDPTSAPVDSLPADTDSDASPSLPDITAEDSTPPSPSDTPAPAESDTPAEADSSAAADSSPAEDASESAPTPPAVSVEETEPEDAPADSLPRADDSSLPPAGATEEAPAAAPMAGGDDPNAGVLYAPGEVLVVFEDHTTPQEAQATLALCEDTLGTLTTKEQLAENNLLLDIGGGATVAQTVDALNASPAVRLAQPNYIYSLPVQVSPFIPVLDTDGVSTILSNPTNDKYYSSQWYLKTIGIKEAWDLQKTEGTVRVGVVDTGVNPSHPDLKANLDMAYARDATTGKSLTKDVEYYGHGTHVAGVISARANNAIGTAGVSYNAKLVPVNVFVEMNGGVGAYTSTIVKAVEYLVTVPGLKVINFSLGGTTYDGIYHDAIKKATALGITCVAAAGNENTATKTYPSDYDEVIAVTALAKTGARADYSNYNQYKNIAAPGSTILSTEKSGDYCYMSGTSMAAPIVAGVAALLYAQNPAATPDMIKEILYNTADDLGAAGRDDYYGHGRINAGKALRYSINTAPTAITLDAADKLGQPGDSFTLAPTILPSFADVPQLNWSTSNASVAVVNSGTVTLVGYGTAVITAAIPGSTLAATCTVTSAAMAGISGITLNHEAKTLKAGGKVTLQAALAPTGTTYSNLAWMSSNKKVATVSASGVVTALKKGKATITATTNEGNFTARCTITVGTPVSKVKLSAKKGQLGAGSSLTLKASVSPAAASNKKVTWSSSNPLVATVSAKGKVTGTGFGKTTIVATTQDGGKTAKFTVTVGPRVRSLSLSKTTHTLKRGKRFTLKATLLPSDAANKAVTWKSSNKKIATVSSKGVVKALKKGTVTITCTSADSGVRAKCKVKIK